MFCGNNHENVDTAVVWFLFCYCIVLIFLLIFFSSRVLFLMIWSDCIVFCLKLLMPGKQMQVFPLWKKEKTLPFIFLIDEDNRCLLWYIKNFEKIPAFGITLITTSNFDNNNLQMEFIISERGLNRRGIRLNDFSLGPFQVEKSFFQIVLTSFSLLWDFTPDSFGNV